MGFFIVLLILMSILAALSRSLAVARDRVIAEGGFDLLVAGLITGFVFGFGLAAEALRFLPGGAMNPDKGMGDNLSEYLVLGGITSKHVFFR